MSIYYHFGGSPSILVNFNIKQYCIQSMRKEQQQRIKAYLDNPQKNPRPMPDEQRHFVYLLTYLGEMFIQGYRIVEQFDDIIILSLMEFQMSEQLAPPQQRIAKKLPSRYKAVLWQYDEGNICDSASIRKSIFSKMITVSSFFGEIQFNIIYLHTAKYSILNKTELQRGGLPSCKDYYKKIDWIERKNAFKPLQEKQEGIYLHQLAELYIKGAGQARNLEIIKRMQSKNKFCYDLFNVIHTLCYVVGKQMLENDYQIISSQKWMRKTTEKKFKRFDLLLRNEDKSGIIDWKFSKLMAQQKIKGNGVKNKNRQYYQLAYKDFLTDVQLKFYCFHTRVHFGTYHYFTCASYFHKIPIEYIDKMEVIISLEEDQDSQNQNIPEDLIKNLDQNSAKSIQEIQVKSSSISANLEISKSNEESIINLDGDDDDSKSTQKQNKSIQIINEKEPDRQKEIQQKDRGQKIRNGLHENNVLQLLASEQARKNEQEIFNEEGQLLAEQKPSKNVKKIDIKQAKFKEKFIDLTSDNIVEFAIEVIDID